MSTDHAKALLRYLKTCPEADERDTLEALILSILIRIDSPHVEGAFVMHTKTSGPAS